MSYDLSIYAPSGVTAEALGALVAAGAGLWPDPQNRPDAPDHPGGVVVLRGKKGKYSFSVEGPFVMEPEDAPEEVTAAVLEPKALYRVSVEGGDAIEVPHAIRFARRLAKAIDGVCVDEQTDELHPKPKGSRTAGEAKPRADEDRVLLHWFILEQDLPEDFTTRYIDIARRLMPEALPLRFGKYDPPYMRLDRDGPEGFAREYNDDRGMGRWSISFKGTYPLEGGSLDGSNPQAGDPFVKVSLSLYRKGFTDPARRAALRVFFLSVATEIGAVFAQAQVQRHSKEIAPFGFEIIHLPVKANKGQAWVGFPPYPLWWVWLGPALVGEIGPFLGPEATDHRGGLFRAFSDEPLDRDQLAEALGPEGLPWIPAEYSGRYAPGIVGHLATAPTVPEILRNRPPRPDPSGR